MSEKKKSNFVPENMAELVEEIVDLSKVRQSLSYGTKTGIRDKAESVISRRINSRVNLLSKHIVDVFGKDEE